MSVNLPVLGIGVTVGGLSSVVAPILTPLVDLVAQVTPPGMPSSSVWFGLGVLMTAIGTAIIQPWLKERGTLEKLSIAMGQIKENTAQIAELKLALQSKDDMIRAKESRVDELVRQLAAASDANKAVTEANVRLADRLFKTSTALLAAIGKIKPMTDALRPVSVDYVGPRPRVLILEDDDVSRNTTATTLDLMGFEVTAVESVTDARDALDGKPFDAAIIDLMLGDGDGADILRSIRDRRLPTTAIITTGRSQETLGPVFALKPDYLFYKPLDMPEIVKVIRSRFGHDPMATPAKSVTTTTTTTVTTPTPPPEPPAK
jgi:CheY-like chemotaxis protein